MHKLWNEWIIEWMNEWMIDRMNEWVFEWMNEWVIEWINKWINEWMYLYESKPPKRLRNVYISYGAKSLEMFLCTKV